MDERCVPLADATEFRNGFSATGTLGVYGDLEFYTLYLARFATGSGFVTLLTLLPEYVSIFQASGIVVGLFTTAFTLAQTVAVLPLAWAGDRGINGW